MGQIGETEVREVGQSGETVGAANTPAPVVDTLWPDALTAGVMEPTVLGAAHGLTVLLTLADGYTLVEVHHCAHVAYKGKIQYQVRNYTHNTTQKKID